MQSIKTIDGIIKGENERVWGLLKTLNGYVPKVLRVGKTINNGANCWSDYVQCLTKCRELNTVVNE